MKKLSILAILLLFITVSCGRKKRPGILQRMKNLIEKPIDALGVAIDRSLLRDSCEREAMAPYGLVELSSVAPSIQVDLRYATTDNFMHKVLYDTLKHVYLQEDVAMRLAECQRILKDMHPRYSLLVYDGVRPLNVQREMWEAMDSIPPAERGKFVSNPVYGSVHNFGAAVDLTICDENYEVLDMGAGYDDFREIAFPKYEARFLKSGELSQEQYENRKLLRQVMKAQSFSNIPSEWWHFNACSRDQAKAKYKKLEYETGDPVAWENAYKDTTN